ncbi:MAG: heme-binding protein [Phycisphaerales bacterium]
MRTALWIGVMGIGALGALHGGGLAEHDATPPRALESAMSPALGTTALKRSLTLEGAMAVLKAAADDASHKGASPSIAVVDDAGFLLCFQRADGSFAAGAEVSIGKARTAAIFKKPTAAFEDSINGGRYALLDATSFTPLRGGVPVIIDGQVVGAVGVSGAASANQDEDIAMTGAAALGSSHPSDTSRGK